MIKYNIENCPDKLYDESRLVGNAIDVFLPENQDELVSLVRSFIQNNENFTIQGGRTSIIGSSVSNNDHIISIENLNKKIEYNKDNNSILCECGVRLSDLKDYIMKNINGYFFAPNPTEPTATISGLISTNAKGTNYIKYGSIVDNLLSIKVLLPNGKIATFHKGEYPIDANEYNLPNGEKLTNLNCNNLYSGVLGLCKNKDILHLFTGTEGILGIILEAELKLTKVVDNKYGVMFFFRDNCGFDFSENIKKLQKNNEISLVGLEYFDTFSLTILRDFKDKSSKLKDIPDIDKNYQNAVYIELENECMDNLETSLFSLLEIFANYGGLEEDTWAGVGQDEIEKFNLLRHSLPEAINVIIEENRKNCPTITKIACDYKLDSNFRELFEMYNTLLNGNIDYALFGHIGDNHLHLNILPKNENELDFAISVVDKLAKFVADNNGVLAFENGVGKLKAPIIKKYINKNYFENARKIKEYLDKNYLFNRGNIL